MRAWLQLKKYAKSITLEIKGCARVSGADLDRVHRVPEPCQRFQIYQISESET